MFDKYQNALVYINDCIFLWVDYVLGKILIKSEYY